MSCGCIFVSWNPRASGHQKEVQRGRVPHSCLCLGTCTSNGVDSDWGRWWLGMTQYDLAKLSRCRVTNWPITDSEASPTPLPGESLPERAPPPPCLPSCHPSHDHDPARHPQRLVFARVDTISSARSRFHTNRTPKPKERLTSAGSRTMALDPTFEWAPRATQPAWQMMNETYHEGPASRRHFRRH